MNTMGKELYLRLNRIARKYELSFNSKDVSFELTVLKNILDKIEELPYVQEFAESTIKGVLIKKWNFNSHTFGFNNCFKKTKTEGEYVTLSAKVTKATVVSIAVTLSDILPMISMLIETTEAKQGDEEQEMELTLCCSKEHEYYGAIMHADLSQSFSVWIYNQDEGLREKVNPKVEASMGILYKKLFSQKPESVGSGLSKNGFVLMPPIRIYTAQFGIGGVEQQNFERFEKQMGYETFCHNLDYEQQQLTLLAGFLEICSFFRESQKASLL